MIHTLAQFYVNILEPGLMILAIVLVVVFVLYLFNLLRGGEGKNDLISNIVNFVIKGIIKFIQLIGKTLLLSLKMLYKTYSLILATVRDFLKSEI